METTAYFARVLRGDLPIALDILSDILIEPMFDPSEMDRERQVICQEIGASLDAPDDLVFDLAQQCAYPGQPLGRPILGTMESVSASRPKASSATAMPITERRPWC